ncbi:hypothetical protein [Paenibacillus amylolyticus]|uniref:hypothetical protein n=1 Tax=Paenibacillus amylolyticus TaxID=1451 RepID=UPI003D98003F
MNFMEACQVLCAVHGQKEKLDGEYLNGIFHGIKQARKQALADDKKNKRKQSSVLLKKGRDVVPSRPLI